MEERMGKPASLRAKLVLLLGSLLVCCVGLLLAEAFCRLFSDVRFQGSSRNLFVANAYGDSKGNARNAEAVSFGGKVYTDRHGFRVPPAFDPGDRRDAPALLILGDSVGFGSGVEEQQTFAGRLRRDLPGTVIYNSSVVGYNTHDYKTLIDHFLPAHDEVRAVVLVYCLNDVAVDSAREIDAALAPAAQGPEPPRGVVNTAKRLPVVRQLNEFLRSRSKLFLTLKIALTDPQQRYWQVDAGLYEGEAPRFVRNIKPLGQISSTLKDLGLPFVVIVAPYEFQVRGEAGEAETPQQKLAEYFRVENIDFVDALPVFRQADADSSDLFLAGDPMHLSELGHQLIGDIILETLRRWGWEG